MEICPPTVWRNQCINHTYTSRHSTSIISKNQLHKQTWCVTFLMKRMFKWDFFDKYTLARYSTKSEHFHGYHCGSHILRSTLLISKAITPLFEVCGEKMKGVLIKKNCPRGCFARIYQFTQSDLFLPFSILEVEWSILLFLSTKRYFFRNIWSARCCSI